MQRPEMEKKPMGTKSLDPPKQNIPPPIQRERNEFGDFIVTKIEIPDLKPKVGEEKQDTESEEEESSDEPDKVEEEKEEKPKVQ